MSGSQIGGVVGGVIGFVVSGYNPAGFQYGYAIGSLVGGIVSPTVIKGPSIGDAQKQTAQAGVPRPVVYGHPAPFMGNIIDGETIARRVIKKVKQGKGGPVVKEEHFLLTSAIRVCEGPIAGIVRIKRNGKTVYDRRRLQDIPGWDGPKAAEVAKYHNEIQAQTAKWAAKCRIYLGDETQLPDPALEMIHGVGNTPYFRGTCYVVIVNDDVTDIQGACAQYQFEVLGSAVEETCVTGDVYVTNIDTTGPSYYRLDASDNTIGQTGANTNIFYSPVLSRDKKRLYVLDPDSGFVSYITIETGALTALPVGCGIFSTTANQALVLDGPNIFGYAINFDNPAFYKFDLYTGAVLDVIVPVGYPGAMCINRAGTRVYVGCCGGASGYYEYNVTTGDFDLHSITNLGGCRGVALNVDETLLFYVGLNTLGGPGSCNIYVIDVATFGIVDTIPIPGNILGQDIAFAPDFSVFAVSDLEADPDGFVWIFSATSYALLYTVTVGKRALVGGLAYNLEGSRLYTTSGESDELAVIDTDGYTVMATIAMPVEPAGVYVWPPASARWHWTELPDSPGTFYDEITGAIYSATGCVPPIGETAVLLRAVEEDICARCNVPMAHLDMTALTDVIPGYLIAEQHTGAECLEPLMAGFFHDLPDYDRKIRAVYRGGASVATIPDDDLIDGSDDDADTRNQQLEYPLKVSVVTQEPEADYSPVPQTSLRFSPDVKSSSEVTISLPIPFGADIAMQCAHKIQKLLWANAEGRQELSLPEEYSRLVVSDPITRGGKRWLVTNVETADGITSIRALYDRASAYESTLLGKSPDPSTVPGSGVIGITMFEFLNIPLLRDSDDELGVYLAATGVLGGWHGALLEASADGGANYSELANVSISGVSVIGKLVSDLPAAPSEVIDTTNTVRVRVYGELESITPDQLLNEFNGCVIGDELCQFQNATLIETGIYDLDMLTRGRLDSTAAAHFAGDRFVLLDNPIFVTLPQSWIGKTLTLRATGYGNEASDNTFTVVWTPARSQTEWSPIQLELERVGFDVTATWIGRGRLGSNATPVHSTFFSGYRVTLDDGIIDPLTFDTEETFFGYDASALGSPLTLSVAAINRLTGVSDAVAGSV